MLNITCVIMQIPAVSKKARISADFFQQQGLSDTAAAAALQKFNDKVNEMAQK